VKIAADDVAELQNIQTQLILVVERIFGQIAVLLERCDDIVHIAFIESELVADFRNPELRLLDREALQNVQSFG
jgi:hypothetical protein